MECAINVRVPHLRVNDSEQADRGSRRSNTKTNLSTSG